MIFFKKQILLLLVALVAGTGAASTSNLRAKEVQGEPSDMVVPEELALQDERELTSDYSYHIQRKAPHGNYYYCLEWGHDDYVYVNYCEADNYRQKWFYYYGYLVPETYRNQVHPDYYKCITWDFWGSDHKNLYVKDCRPSDYKYGIFQYWNYYNYKFISAYFKNGQLWCIDHNRDGGDVAHMKRCQSSADYDQEWKVTDSFYWGNF